MTTTSQIIIDAYRQSNLLALSATLANAQFDEALRYLNRIVKSVSGNEVGELLENMAIGRNDISRPQGFPFYDRTPGNNWFVPKNTRLMCNITSPLTVYLNPMPDDGSRFGVIDMSNDFATSPLTVVANGRLIDGAISEVLNVSGFVGEWLYRDDIGSWMQYAPLVYTPDTVPVVDTTFPFPEEFDDFFITMLAMRINPAYGAQVDQQSNAILMRTQKQLKSRYTQHRFVPTESGIWRTPDVSADRKQWGYGTGSYDSTAEFNTGRPYGQGY